MSTATKNQRNKQRQRARSAARQTASIPEPQLERTVEWGDPLLRWTAVAGLVAAGALHGLVVESHLQEWAASGYFFLALSLLQIGAAMAIVAKPHRLVGLAAIGVNATALVVYVVSRTSGMPFGPDAGIAGPVGPADLISAIAELVAVAALVPLLNAPVRPVAPRSAGMRAQLAVVGFGMLALTAVGAPDAVGHAEHEQDRAADSSSVSQVAEARTPERSRIDLAESEGNAGPVGVDIAAAPPADVRVQLAAVTSDFRKRGYDKGRLSVPAGSQAVLDFTNADTQDHNVSLYRTGDDALTDVFVGKVISGGDSVAYPFVAPERGTFQYRCDLHPWMVGELEAT